MTHIKTAAKTFLISSAFLAGLWFPNHAQSAEILSEILTQDSKPYRILQGSASNEFWVVDERAGLILLVENPPGSWTQEPFAVGHVADAVGPDSDGLLYCSSFVTGLGSVVQVFDTASRQITNTLFLGQDYILTGLALSTDQDKLYVLGWDWPRAGQFGGWVEIPGHPDEGLIWEIDTATLAVSPDVAMVGSMPQTIYYAEGDDYDKLYLYTGEHGPLGGWLAGWVDVIGLIRGFPRVARISTSSVSDYPYVNDLIKWSDTDPFMVICNRCVDRLTGYPEYSQGIWIVNTDTDSVVQRFTILDSDGHVRGVKHACVSQVHPGTAYLSLGFGGPAAEIAVIDCSTGQVIDSIRADRVFTPEFIYELPDGRLIVTGGRTSNILIIDPEC